MTTAPSTAQPTTTPLAPFRPLTTARLALRALRAADAEAMFGVFGDAETMRYWSHPPYASLAEMEAKLASLLTAPDDHRTWAITLPGRDEFLGWVSLFAPTPLQLSLGYVLAPAARGKGYASEAVCAALAFAFEACARHRVDAELDPRNLASARLLSRLGFTDEGIRRQNYLYGDEITDTQTFGLLNAEWRAGRSVERGAA